MERNTKKGLITGFFGVIFVGLQPIIARLRPIAVDAYLSGAMTCLVEMIIFFPIMLIEFKSINSKSQIVNNKGNQIIKLHFLKGWKKNFWLLIFIGLLFGLNQILFFIGYDLAEPIIGSLTQKTTVFFSLFLGYILLKERITKRQVVFSIFLFLGLAISITDFFTLINISLNILMGVGIILAISLMWIFGHTLTKPMFSRDEVTPIQMVFIRNMISGGILVITYLIFFTPNISIFIEPGHLLFFFLMGSVYGAGLVCWYKTLSYLEVSKATTVFAPTPISSAVFAIIILGHQFTIAHLVGTIIIIISIIIIVNQKKE
ncbi:MAG: EamA family transporter [Promethearchaeota archaeon]|nr:MAG: EamA family transporter [Candidatus Lokiarchaeota archaeon]